MDTYFFGSFFHAEVLQNLIIFYEIIAGKTDPFRKGEMIAWHNKTTLNYWSSPSCNQVSGRDPSGLPLNLSPSDNMDLFIGQICRPLLFKFEKNTVVDNEFATMRFIPEETSFSSPDQVPENQCYCLRKVS